MANALKNDSLTTRLFLEGVEVDLDTQIDIANTYAVSDIKNIKSKGSSYSKTITVPGTANNNKLLSFLFDIKSVGQEMISGSTFPYTATVFNNISGVTVTDANNEGTEMFPLPILFGQTAVSFHNQLNNTEWHITISGQTDTSGYIVCALNGNVISCNRIAAAVSTYFFPQGFYLYNDVLQITLQKNFQSFNGNIGYSLDYKKKMRAYVIQDNQVILSGYAKILSATSKDEAVSYSLQITSDLGGFISVLANQRLEDLYTNVSPDLVAAPDGSVSKIIDLVSPYDHVFTLGSISESWIAGIVPFAYPLIDYGEFDTVGQTNFYTENFRPALFAKSYIDQIFSRAGYTYDSAFLNSEYFGNLIIPYKDGNYTIIDTYPVEVTSNAQSGITVVPDVTGPQANSFYVFNTVITDVFGVYNPLNESYVATVPGTYIVSMNAICNYNFTLGDPGPSQISPLFDIFVLYEVFPASGGTLPYAIYENVFGQDMAAVTVGGNPVFTASSLTDNFNVSVTGVPVTVVNAGDIIKVRISPTSINSASLFFPDAANPGTTQYPGSAVLNVINNIFTGIEPDLQISYSTNKDGQLIRFKDFVPKSVKQIDYINSIVKLFNLYPVQDPDKRNHFYIYTRDEFFSSQITKDWSNKVDNLSDIIIKPIPELDASQLLFSYKPDKDWWNKQYDALYGNFTYGARRVETGYEFANKVNDVMSGTIFGPTPIIEMGIQAANGEGTIEILNQPFTFPGADVGSDVVMSTGYYAANVGESPTATNWPTANVFSGTKLTKAKVGVHILYWGIEYIISFVFNDYAFKVTDLDGTAVNLIRPIQQSGARRQTDTYYATADTFTYLTNSNIAIPAIYDSSDNNITHKPCKTEMKILYFQTIEVGTTNYNTIVLQYTPIPLAGINNYQIPGIAPGYGTDPPNFTNPFYEHINQIAYASHLDDPVNPTKDLLFDTPISLFFDIDPSAYPTKNLYTRYWINTVNEITDSEAKMMDCMLDLNSVDIATLDLSQLIFIRGTNYRINQIQDYSPDSSLTKAEFIRIPRYTQTTPSPLVSAGPDQVLSGMTATFFAGTASGGDNDGEVIVKTIWKQVAGPSGVTISNTGNLLSAVGGFVSGNTYTFQLEGIDNYGNAAFDTMNITGAPHGPCNPFVTASNGGDIIMPVSGNTLTGTAAGCNGSTISSVLWTQISGTTVTITNATSLNAILNSITIAGSYTFLLTATDNYSEIGSASTTFVLHPSPTVTINNRTGITLDVSGIVGLTQDGPVSLPVINATFKGLYSSFTGAISVILSGTSVPVGTLDLVLLKNGTQIDCIDTDSGDGTYTFGSHTFNGTDTLDIEFSTGRC